MMETTELDRILAHLGPAAKSQLINRDRAPMLNAERDGRPGSWHRYNAKYMAYCHSIGTVLLIVSGAGMYFTPDAATEHGMKWLADNLENIRC
jgi:hypothetical protein